MTDHSKTVITQTFWALPERDRTQFLEITKYIVDARWEGVLQYDVNDELKKININNSIGTILNNSDFKAILRSPRLQEARPNWLPENSHNRCFISHLYHHHGDAFFNYLIANMSNTTLIEALPTELSYITDATTVDTVDKLLTLLNSVFTINKIKELLTNKAYWYNLRGVCFNTIKMDSNVFTIIRLNLHLGTVIAAMNTESEKWHDYYNQYMNSVSVPQHYTYVGETHANEYICEFYAQLLKVTETDCAFYNYSIDD